MGKKLLLVVILMRENGEEKILLLLMTFVVPSPSWLPYVSVKKRLSFFQKWSKTFFKSETTRKRTSRPILGYR